MPIYEYFCPNNQTIYSFYAPSPRYAQTIPQCPANPGFHMEKRLSAFSTPKRKGEEDNPAGDETEFDDAQAEALMKELEQDMGGLDENNPDLRKLAKLMRKMGDMTGQGMTPAMDEMARRLERGEDPEVVEQELGSTLEQEMDSLPDDVELSLAAGRRLLRAGTGTPKRDPNLYQLLDYLPSEGEQGR
jgi:FtsP/CotA-like multicopper oxidase with cupredoxin domain